MRHRVLVHSPQRLRHRRLRRRPPLHPRSPPLPIARVRGRSCPARRVLVQSRLELRSSRLAPSPPLRRARPQPDSRERVAMTAAVRAVAATIAADAAEEKASGAR